MEDYDLNEVYEAEADTETEQDDKNNTGIVIGAIVGGVAAVGAAVAGLVHRHKKKVAEKERVGKLEQFYKCNYDLLSDNEVSKTLFADLVPADEQPKKKFHLFKKDSKEEESKK